MIFELLTIFL